MHTKPPAKNRTGPIGGGPGPGLVAIGRVSTYIEIRITWSALLRV